MSDSLRLRIAPSPTGAIHLGLARTALFNWAYARGRAGAFVLRIEDTDRERSSAESERAILEGLRWLGLDWDEGPDVGGPCAPYRQSERGERHRELAERLVGSGSAYRCFCSAERLAELREAQAARKETPAYDRLCSGLEPAAALERARAGEPFVVRFRVPAGVTSFEDLVRGAVSFENRDVDDWVMVRSDGGPTYNFVVVCDDADMRISHVFRGEEHLVNTPKQVLLYRALGVEPPRFGHLPLLLGKDKKKLSKRSGDTSIEDYRSKGYPRGAIVNFLALQGWALDGATEIFSVEELVRRFDIRGVAKAGAVFDLDKFAWLAAEYLRAEPVEELAAHCRPFVVEAGLATPSQLDERADWFLRVVESERERIGLYADLPGRVAHLFARDEAVPFDPKAEKGARKHAERIATLSAYLAWLCERADEIETDPEGLGEATRGWIASRGLAMPALFQPLRCALTGLPGGPDLFETMALLGRESTLARIERGIERLV